MNERQLDAFNQQLRVNPAYRAYLQSIGVRGDRMFEPGFHLSDVQRKQAEEWIRRNVQDIGDLEIDPAGNANQNEGVGKWAKDWRTYAAIGGGLTGLGALGFGPLSGVFGAGAGAGAAGGELAAGSIPTSLAMQAVPASIASQGVSAGLGAGLAGAGGAGAAGTAAAAGGGAASVASRAADAASNGGSSWWRDLATPENGVALAALIAGLSGSNQNAQGTEEIRRIQAINEARMRRADPLHQVATNLAFGRLPVNYRQGVQLNNVPLPG